MSDDQSLAGLIARIQTESVSFAEVGHRYGLPARTVDLLDHCLAKRISERTDIGELIRALRMEQHAADPGPLPPRDRWRHRRNLVTGGTMLLSVVVFSFFLGHSHASRSEASPAPNICRLYANEVRDRRDLLNEISSDLEQGAVAYEVVERLFVTYPERMQQIQEPLMTAAAQVDQSIRPVFRDDLSELALAEGLRALTGGKPFLFGGQDGSFDPSLLPGELRGPAEAVSQAHHLAATECPSVKVDLTGPKARMDSAIMANLANAKFLDAFFSDPRSYAIFNSENAVVLTDTARPFVDTLLTGHWAWLFAALKQHPAARSALAFEHPDLLLTAVAADPTLLRVLKQHDWAQEVRLGYEHLGPAERLGLRTAYGQELAEIGITST